MPEQKWRVPKSQIKQDYQRPKGDLIAELVAARTRIHHQKRTLRDIQRKHDEQVQELKRLRDENKALKKELAWLRGENV